MPAISDAFFLEAVRPFCWFAAVLLFLSYIIGLWFTLRTHAATIWNIEIDEKKAQGATGMNGSISHQPLHGAQSTAKLQTSGSSKDSTGRGAIRDTQLYKRILSQSLKQEGLSIRTGEDSRHASTSSNAPHGQPPHVVPPKGSEGDSVSGTDNASQRSVHIAGLSEEDSNNLVRQVAEMAATAAAVAAKDATRAPRKTSAAAHTAAQRTPHLSAPPTAVFQNDHETALAAGAEGPSSGGHDAPNWGRVKSAVILLGATILYAVIAEILVNTVDVVLESVDLDEKFLGITLFALVPNTTEFLVSPGSVTNQLIADV